MGDHDREILAALQRIADRDDARVWSEIGQIRQVQHQLRTDLAGLRLAASSDLTEHITEHHHPLATRVAVVEKTLSSLDNSISDVEKDLDNSKITDRRKLEDQAKWWESGWGKIAIEIVKVIAAAAIGGGLLHSIFK